MYSRTLRVMSALLIHFPNHFAFGRSAILASSALRVPVAST
jgi:hypothetical protein